MESTLMELDKQCENPSDNRQHASEVEIINGLEKSNVLNKENPVPKVQVGVSRKWKSTQRTGDKELKEDPMQTSSQHIIGVKHKINEDEENSGKKRIVIAEDKLKAISV